MVAIKNKKTHFLNLFAKILTDLNYLTITGRR